jgi:hypothetical protein
MPAPIPSAEPVTTAILFLVDVSMLSLSLNAETLEQKMKTSMKNILKTLFDGLTLLHPSCIFRTYVRNVKVSK